MSDPDKAGVQVPVYKVWADHWKVVKSENGCVNKGCLLFTLDDIHKKLVEEEVKLPTVRILTVEFRAFCKVYNRNDGELPTLYENTE